MIELLINKIIEEPTKDTAPLFLAINNTASKATQGLATGRFVALTDRRRDDEGEEVEIPYVRIYDDGQKQMEDRALMMLGGEVENEARLMVVEIACQGETKVQASFRAEKLRLLVMVMLRSMMENLSSSLEISDDSGTGSTYKIDRWFISPGDDPHTQGPGLAMEYPTYTSLKYISVDVKTTLMLLPN